MQRKQVVFKKLPSARRESRRCSGGHKAIWRSPEKKTGTDKCGHNEGPKYRTDGQIFHQLLILQDGQIFHQLLILQDGMYEPC
jgi:hypothetical protein